LHHLGLFHLGRFHLGLSHRGLSYRGLSQTLAYGVHLILTLSVDQPGVLHFGVEERTLRILFTE
jgi:hypothetical protein